MNVKYSIAINTAMAWIMLQAVIKLTVEVERSADVEHNWYLYAQFIYSRCQNFYWPNFN